MKKWNLITALIFLQLFFASAASAGDFDWLNNLNVKAEADSSGFRVQLATRFRIGDAEVKAVIGNVDRKSDAYMVFRLGELSHQPVKKVLSVYNSNRGKGWGVIAKKLGIKPGSSEFHALKSGHDLDNNSGGGKGSSAKKMNYQEHSKGDHGNGNGKGKK